jgi:hypothetical protein
MLIKSSESGEENIFYSTLYKLIFFISVSKTTRELLLHWSRVSYIYIFIT